MEECVSDQLFDAVRRPTLITDREGIIQKVNSAFLSTFDFACDDVIGSPFTDFFEPSGNWKSAGVDGLYLSFQMRTDTAIVGGGRLQINSFSTADGGGYFIFVDTSTSFEADELLSALSFVVERFPHPILVWDKSAQLMKYNQAAARYYGPVGDIFRPGQARQTLLRAAMEKGVLGGTPIGGETPFDKVLDMQYETDTVREPISLEIQRQNGASHRVTAYHSPDGWSASFYEDITELRQAQSELSDRTREFELILENVPDFVVVADKNFKLTYANPSFAKVIGKPVDALYGKTCLPGGDDIGGRGPIEELIEKATPDNPDVDFDELRRDADADDSWIRWRTKVLFEGNERAGLIKVGRDITRQQEQEASLRQQSAELRKKNESLEQFAAVVSHDLKAPLRHIAIFADMLVEDANQGKYAELINYAKHVQNSAVRMDRVIKRLLEYSKLAYKAISRQNINLSDIVIQAVQNLETQIENARAEILASDLPDYYGDPDLLRQVFQNLIGNAVKYARAGTRPRVRIYSLKKSSSLEFCIEDNGIGIDPKYADSIFTAFRRLHKDETVYDGFGVGLALCKQIVESHQGEIRLDTTYGAGSRFVIRLPLQQ